VIRHRLAASSREVGASRRLEKVRFAHRGCTAHCASSREVGASRRLEKVRFAHRGFTLLEVMVSLAILAVSLVAVLNLHSGSVRVHNHAKHLTVATLLARSKMIDVEERLLAEDLPQFDERHEGTFEEEGYPGYGWTVEVVKPKLGLDATAIQGLLGQAMGFLGGGDDAGGGLLGGLDEMGLGGGIEGMIQGQVQGLLDTLEESVREVRLTVHWNDITGHSEFSVVTHIVRMEGQGAPGGAEEQAREQLERQSERLQQQNLQEELRGLPGRMPSLPGNFPPGRGGGPGLNPVTPRLPGGGDR
jgi:general secretion pathway protein I